MWKKAVITALVLGVLLSPSFCKAKSYLIVLDREASMRLFGNYQQLAVVPQLQRDFKARVAVVGLDTDSRPGQLNKYLTDGYELIIGVGFYAATTVNNAAMNNKRQTYALVDLNRGNLTSNAAGFAYSYAEAGYMAGFIAARNSESGSIGFIGGQRLVQTQDFARGFRDGAKHAVPEIKIKTVYLDSFFDAYAARSQANSMYYSGVDVICHLAGAGGQGVVEAAQKTDKWVVDVAGTKPEALPRNTLACLLIDYDKAIYEICRQAESGQFKGGATQLYNFANGGLDVILAAQVLHTNQQTVKKLKQEIINGSVVVRNNNNRIVN